MWNSNAVIAWVLSRSGIDAAQVMPPRGGRAPGWNAGLAVARRSDAERALSASIAAAPTPVPARRSRLALPRRASGRTSTATRASIAPAANANDSGSSELT